MGQPDPRGLVTACVTHVGQVRSANQDDVGEFTNPSGCRLIVVADGMGGHAGGEVASRTCIERIAEVFQSATGDHETVLRTALEAANERVYRLGMATPGLRGMGTTAVVMLFDPEESDSAWVAHVGDSRAYRLHEGKLDRITDDHSWVFEEVRQQRLTPEEAEVHPRRNALLRSIGVDPGVEVDTRRVDLAGGDRFMLCSDGLWGEVDHQTIAGVLASQDPKTGAQELVDLANRNGGRDNITVAWVAVPGAVDTMPLAPMPAKLSARFARGTRARALGIAAAVVAGIAIVALAWLVLGSG